MTRKECSLRVYNELYIDIHLKKVKSMIESPTLGRNEEPETKLIFIPQVFLRFITLVIHYY